MLKPVRPTPAIILEADEKKMDDYLSDEDAFRAQSKTTNFGLELFKFLAPAEVAWYSYDSETGGKTSPGFQGILANNAAWWTDSQHYVYDKQVYTRPSGDVISHKIINELKEAGQLNAEIAAGRIKVVTDFSKILQMDSKTTNPLWVLDETQNWHNPDPIEYAASETVSFFGRTHRSSPLFDGGIYAGTNAGRLSNVNPFAGLAGGYSDSNYSKDNTWNHYEVTEKNKSNWDYGMSRGYQSVSKLDNVGDSDWQTMDDILKEISAQGIAMKNSHQGWTTDKFHRQGQCDYDWGEWRQDTSSKHKDSKYGAVTTYYDHPGKKTTQAPNYFEIINSGAFSQWTTDGGNITKSNIDDRKFYYFSKALLESKRRALEAYRHLFGKVSDLARQGFQEPVRDNNIGDNKIYRDGSNILDVAKNQCSKIKDWYENVCKKTDFNNNFYNFVLFRIAHGAFNHLEALASGRETRRGGGKISGSYTEIGENDTFRNMAIYGSYKYLTKSTNRLNSLKSSVFNTQKSIIQKKYGNRAIEKKGGYWAVKIGENWQKVTASENSDLNSAQSVQNYSLPDIDKLTGMLDYVHNTVRKGDYDTLETLEKALPKTDMAFYNSIISSVKYAQKKYGWSISTSLINLNFMTIFLRKELTKISIKLQDIFESNKDTNFKKDILTYMNAIAPICELFRPAADEDDAELKDFRMPIADFAHYRHTGETDINNIELDVVPHSLWSGGQNIQAYDAYAQLGGYGMSWHSKGGRRDGITSIFRMNPILSAPDFQRAVSRTPRNRENFSYLGETRRISGMHDKGDKFDYINHSATSIDMEYILGKNFRDDLWSGGKTGTYHQTKVTNEARGAVREIEINPAYAAAGYYFETREDRKGDIQTSLALTFFNLQDSRRKSAEYEEKSEEYEFEQREDRRTEARIMQEAAKERKRIEQILEQRARERRAEQNRAARRR